MSKVIVITSGKGGVGKTTSTANIGSALSALGKKVVIVDADIGLRNLDVVMGLENRIVFDITIADLSPFTPAFAKPLSTPITIIFPVATSSAPALTSPITSILPS